MSNLLTADELVRTGQTRSFYQPGGAGNDRFYGGVGQGAIHFISAATKPSNGAVNPIYIPDPLRPTRYRLVSRTIDPEELPTMTAIFHEMWAGVPRLLMGSRCATNFYEVHGRCKDLSDLLRGWDNYVLIYADMIPSGSTDLGTRTVRDSDTPLTNTQTYTGRAIYPAAAISFGDEAAADVLSEVIDLVFGTETTCGNCGAINEGNAHLYALTRTNVSSPPAPGELIYTTDGGLTWQTDEIDGIGDTAEPRYIDIAGAYLFVGTDATALLYSRIDIDTAAPSAWQSVTLPAAMDDVHVASASQIYFVSTGGNVYKTESILVAPTLIATGGTDLNRIHGIQSTLVAVGDSGVVYYSNNDGLTWATATAPAATNLNAVQVLSEKAWYVGGADGNLYKTSDRGSTWETIALPVTSGGVIQDITASTPEVIWVSYTENSVAYLVTTIDGGTSWAASNGDTPRILNWPTHQRANRIAVPVAAIPEIAANYVGVAGLATSGTDGVLLLGGPTIR